MTIIDELNKKIKEVREINACLHKTGNTSEFLTQKVNELLAEEWDLRLRCAQEGIVINED